MKISLENTQTTIRYASPKFSIVLLISVLMGCSPRVANLDSTGESIVCFGDSITKGIYIGSGNDYPSVLGQKVAWPVINAGASGDTTHDALKRIEADVLAHNPRMVIVMLGGNDFLRKIPLEKTLANIDTIVVKIQEHGAVVVLAALRLGLLKDNYTKKFKNIAKKRGALFVPNIMKGILTNPKLKYDQIHPNAEGYRLIADRIYKAIAPLL